MKGFSAKMLKLYPNREHTYSCDILPPLFPVMSSWQMTIIPKFSLFKWKDKRKDHQIEVGNKIQKVY